MRIYFNFNFIIPCHLFCSLCSRSTQIVVFPSCFIVVGTDVLRWRRLKQRLGTALLPLIGSYSGYYPLDLTFSTDRVCLKRLIERSVKNCDSRIRAKLGDTSQHGNWTCFRNEYHPDLPDARIVPKYFYPMPEKAKVEFDFVNINRPDVTVNRAVGDDIIVDMILITRLLDEDKVDWALGRLAEMGAALRKCCLSNGRPHWKMDISRAVAVNETVYGYYGNYATRKNSLLKSQKREVAMKTVSSRESTAGIVHNFTSSSFFLLSSSFFFYLSSFLPLFILFYLFLGTVNLFYSFVYFV